MPERGRFHPRMRIAILSLNRGRGSGEVSRHHAAELLSRGHEVRLLYPMMDEGVPGADNRSVPLHSPVLPVHEYLPCAGAEQRQVAAMGTAEALAYTADYAAASTPPPTASTSSSATTPTSPQVRSAEWPSGEASRT